jgi:hypothetical protein
MRLTVTAIFASTLLALPASALELMKPADHQTTVLLEASVLWPALFGGRLYTARVMVPLFERGTFRGQLLTGFQFRLPEVRPDEGTFSEVSGRLGWRQYFIQGLHGEVIFGLGLGMTRNAAFDGRNANSLDLDVVASLGYELRLWRFGLVLQPLGIGQVLAKSNPVPRADGSTTEVPAYVGNVLLNFSL